MFDLSQEPPSSEKQLIFSKFDSLSELYEDVVTNGSNEMEKKQVDIKKCMDIYGILDKFHHKFENDEDYDKMWRVYGAPVETIQRIGKQ